MKRPKSIFVTGVALLLAACATPTKSILLVPPNAIKEKIAVVQGTSSKVRVKQVLSDSGWSIINTSLSANISRQTISTTTATEKESSTIQESFSKVSAKYLVEFEGQQSDSCIGLVGYSKGFTPHYTLFSLSIADISTGKEIFNFQSGGCEEDVMVSLQNELMKLKR